MSRALFSRIYPAPPPILRNINYERLDSELSIMMHGSSQSCGWKGKKCGLSVCFPNTLSPSIEVCFPSLVIFRQNYLISYVIYVINELTVCVCLGFPIATDFAVEFIKIAQLPVNPLHLKLKIWFYTGINIHPTMLNEFCCVFCVVNAGNYAKR